MSMRKRILDIRKQSRISHLKEDIWFYSENSANAQSPVKRRKLTRNDRLSILNEDYDRYSLENPENRRIRKDCLFVVDWQMSDPL